MMTTQRKMTTRRSLAALAIGGVALLGVTLPAGASATTSQDAVSTQRGIVTSVNDSQPSSDASLVSAAGVFLAVGIGSITIAHRRRWNDQPK